MSHVIDQVAESVLISDADGVIQYVNPYFTTETGYVAEEAVGKTPAILKSGVQSADFYRVVWEQISAGKVWRGNMTDRRKDGTLYTTRMTVSPVFDAHGQITHYVGIQSDITRQIELEEEIRHMQKMESLGTLVGGIAHEFNNMLAGIKGNLYLAGKRAKGVTEIQSRLEAADRLSSRAADMIQQMLTFARKDMVQKLPLSLRALVGDGMQMLRISVPEDIELLVDLGEEDLVIHGDPTQLQQILLNLLANARDAMEGMGRRGQVRVRLDHRTPDSEVLLKQWLDSSMECAVLEISDNGCGISPDIRDKIFEPFYTTKDVGKGTGLGLAMVFGAVHGHGGAIELDSVQGRGTTFRIWLPLNHVDEGSGLMTRPEVVRGRGETILVADDEQAVLESLSEVLDAIGYQTVTARDGEEALALFAQASDHIAAVVLDVVMPRMNGADAARQMRVIRTDLPIIFTTGYDRNSVLHHCERFGQSHLMIKPVAPAELSHLMRELLDEAEALKI
jgi:PAS domain S-box-containing protein